MTTIWPDCPLWTGRRSKRCVAVHAAAPGAEECISYGMPAFRLDGKLIAGFRAARGHCSYHPMSGVASQPGSVEADEIEQPHPFRAGEPP